MLSGAVEDVERHMIDWDRQVHPVEKRHGICVRWDLQELARTVALLAVEALETYLFEDRGRAEVCRAVARSVLSDSASVLLRSLLCPRRQLKHVCACGEGSRGWTEPVATRARDRGGVQVEEAGGRSSLVQGREDGAG